MCHAPLAFTSTGLPVNHDLTITLHSGPVANVEVINNTLRGKVALGLAPALDPPPPQWLSMKGN